MYALVAFVQVRSPAQYKCCFVEVKQIKGEPERFLPCFVFRRNMKKTVALVDVRMPAEGAEALSEYGYKVIRVPGADYLAPPVCSHPDMIFLSLGEKLFCHRRYLLSPEGRNTAENIISCTGETLAVTDDETGDEYPLDVGLNAAVIGDVFISSPHTSREVLSTAVELGMNVLRVKQGYVKCSAAVIDGERKGIITSDSGIARAAKNVGIAVLTVPAGDILLPGYDYGFIGGCTGYDDGRMFFSGDLSLYRYGKETEDFLSSLGCTPVSLLPGCPLTDYGSILFL